MQETSNQHQTSDRHHVLSQKPDTSEAGNSMDKSDPENTEQKTVKVFCFFMQFAFFIPAEAAASDLPRFPQIPSALDERAGLMM